MVKILVTGHGGFAAGMETAVKMLSGQHEELAFINFSETLSTTELKTQLENNLGKKGCGGTLILCDLVGGTPFNTAVSLSAHEEDVEVIGGMNLGMLVEAIFSRDICPTIKELVEKCMESVKVSVQHFTMENTDDMMENSEL